MMMQPCVHRHWFAPTKQTVSSCINYYQQQQRVKMLVGSDGRHRVNVGSVSKTQVRWTLRNVDAKWSQVKGGNCLIVGCMCHIIILLSWLCECHPWLQARCCCPHIWLGYTHASMSNGPIAHHLVCLTLICSSKSPRGRLHWLWDL